MMRACLLATLLLAACGTAPPVAGEATEPQPSSPPDLAVLIAAVEAGLEDTVLQGAALADPETFISTGRVICEEMDAGADIDEVLGAYLAALAAAEPAGSPDDRATVAGVVTGASLEVLCPDHVAKVTSGERS